jgi:hypothetical protein
MSTPPESPSHAGDSWRWWEGRRLRYNIGLAIAGALAWALFAIEASLLTDWFSLSVAATLAQGLAWLVVMGVANLAFFLGPVSERIFKPDDPDAYRRRIYGLGFWFSMAVPFLLPAVTLIAILATLGY